MSEMPEVLARLSTLLGADPAGLGLVAGIGLLASVVAVAAYVVYVLPRLNDLPAVLVSAMFASALLAIDALLSATSDLTFPVMPAWAALWVGHLGWRSGRFDRSNANVGLAASSSSRTSRSVAANPRPVPNLSPPPTDSPDTLPPSAPPDRAQLGRYRIDRQLGRGAMGAVYLGLDPKIGRPVAIKTMALAQEFDGNELADARERFFREAETAGRLRHPDIVTIFDAGEDDELAYIAMEFAPGHDLQRHTRLGTLLPVPQVLRVVERVSEALAYAHSQGVVHRDIKPANVMVDLDAADGLAVKVTDFGIARVVDTSRTRTGMVLGTPAFMSPEQMAGRRVDGRSDLYSLGVMLFQLLTGRLPHHAESMARLMSSIANERAPDIRSIRPELPEALADIVALALEKRPEVRYADGRQMALDLQTVQSMYGPLAADDHGANASLSAPADAVDAFTATVKLNRDDTRHNSRG